MGKVSQRHHRYEFNNEYKEVLTAVGFVYKYVRMGFRRCRLTLRKRVDILNLWVKDQDTALLHEGGIGVEKCQMSKKEQAQATLEQQLDMEREYLGVMYRKYILVYYVDLAVGKAKVLKLDPHANVWKMPQMRPNAEFDFTEHIKSFVNQFVTEKDQQEFLALMEPHYIERRLQSVSRYAFRFEGIPNQAGHRYYQVYIVRVNPERFDGKVMIVSEEVDDVVEAEQQRQEELDIERRYLDVLTHNFSVVYHVDLHANTSKLIKVDAKIALQEVSRISLRQTNNYQERVELYSRKFVIPVLQKEFLRVMQPQNLLQRLKNAKRFVYRYRTIVQKGGYQYYEMNAMRMDDDPESGDILIAFCHIDDVVTVEQQQQIELAERLERERSQNEVLSALSGNYHAIFLLDLEQDSYTEIVCREAVRPYYNDGDPSAARTLAALCEKIVACEYAEHMLRFFDLSTLSERLKERDFVETECVTTEGNWHRARFIVKRRDAHGQVTHVLYLTQIIDDEKRYENNLIARAEYANYANRAKTDFISQVAHDIRTPMNSIFGFLEIAEANLDDPEKVYYSLERIRKAGEFLKDLVNDVLDISRMEKGVTKLNEERVNLVSLLDEFAVSMQNAKFEKTQRIHFDFQGIKHEWIKVDAMRLKQIYNNVLSNAIKYTPDGGEITFSVYQEEVPESDHVRIISTITDNGIGMSEEFMEKMFVKFERGTDTRVNAVSGYGLGLSIVKQLVELMNGSLNVESQLGEGTTVCIALEVPSADESKEKKQKKEQDYAAKCRGMHLLVAEDNELNCEVMTELLAMYDITCECVGDGRICLERMKEAKEDTFDAILMDMQMPNMNGVEAARWIRMLPNGQKIPIIAMTANALKDDVKSCLQAGMNCHLSKPVDVGLLMKALSESKTKN